jgi:hypothetical protein
MEIQSNGFSTLNNVKSCLQQIRCAESMMTEGLTWNHELKTHEQVAFHGIQCKTLAFRDEPR